MTPKYYTKDEFWNKVAFVSLLSAILILTMHTINNVNGKYANSPLSTEFLNYIHYFTRNAVKLFWMISAFLFYRDYNLSKTTSKYKSRFNSLVIPYLLWNLIGIFFTWTISSTAVLSEQVNSLSLFYPSWQNLFEGLFHYKYNIIFWFIFELILLVALAPFIYIMLSNKYIGVITLVVFYFVSPYIFDNQNIIRGGNSWGYYLAAAYAGIHFYKQIQIKVNNKIAFICGVAAVMLTYLQMTYQSYRFLMTFITCLSCTLMWFSADCLMRYYRKWMIGISMFIYAIHFNIDMVVSKIIVRALPDFPEVSALAFLLAWFVTIALSVSIAFILRKYTPKLYYLLNGGR